MTDIKLNHEESTGLFDIELSSGDLMMEDGLETAVYVSLFTDARAGEGDDVPNEQDPDLRGWWGDVAKGSEQAKTGSRLWLLKRAKNTSSAIGDAKVYIEEALQWLLDRGVVEKVDVNVEAVDRQTLGFQVILYRKGKVIAAPYYSFLWGA